MFFVSLVERNISIPLSAGVVQAYRSFCKIHFPDPGPVEISISCVERLGTDGDGHYKISMTGLSVGKVLQAFETHLIEHNRFVIQNSRAVGYIIGRGSSKLEALRRREGIFSIRLVQDRLPNDVCPAWLSMIGTRTAVAGCVQDLRSSIASFEKLSQTKCRKLSTGNNSTAISDS